LSRIQALQLGDLSGLDELPPTPAEAAATTATAAEVVDAGPPKPLTDRDIQRQALRDLIALSSESAATESDIEREYRTGKDEAGKSSGDRAFGIEQRHRQAMADAEQQGKAKLASIAQRYKAERQKLAAADAAAKKKADADKQSVDARLKQQFDEKVFAADTELEASSHRANLAYKQVSDRVNGAGEELNGLEVAAGNKVVKYGLRMPPDAVVIADDDPARAAIAADADAAYAAHRAEAEQTTAKLNRLPLANLTIPARLILISIVVGLAAAAAAQATTGNWSQFDPKRLGIVGGAGFAVAAILLGIGRFIAVKQIRAIHAPVRRELALARLAAERQLANAAEKRKADLAAAAEARAKEIAAAKDAAAPVAAKAAKGRTDALAAAAADAAKQAARLEKMRDAALAEANEASRRLVHDIEHKKDRDLKETRLSGEARAQAVEDRYRQRRAELEQHWADGLARIQTPIDKDGQTAPSNLRWDDPAWKTWKPNKTFATRVRFGELHVDLSKIADNVPQRLTLPETFALPALLAFPGQGSLLIHTDHAGRAEAIRTLQMTMTRLLTSLPAGRVRFTIIDPVGLGQNFAGFMHLTDYDDALVGGRIWTSQDQIDEKLRNLADHMENVIQKYLRNEFATIDDYNAQAGPLAEPYRYLVISDLPVNFTAEAFRRLNAIATSGPRCGVYTLIARDVRASLPAGAHLDELVAHSVNLIREGDRFVWDDEGFKQLPLQLDPPAAEDVLTELLHKVGAGAREAKRIEVPFEQIAPQNGQMWSRSTTKEIDVMVGRTGATRFQSLKLGKGTSQHVLIAGKTGSGKSTLMHAMITNAALWYSPDEIELYLVDFKKGVEFKTYATNLLPHARAIAIESDREFGLSLLTRLDQELTRRGELFRKAGGAQNLEMYRATEGALVVPRTLLIIDEYQEFFTEDDRLAQDATLLIERLVRQGRAFGMHVLLGSQTAGGLPRGVMEQFAVRIALATTEAGSQIILGDNNSAARLLTRPGEAIYNDGGGLVENNSPFQVAFLSDEKRDAYLKDLASKAEPYFKRFGYPIVFEGNAAADTTRNAKLNAALDQPAWPRSIPGGALGWLGEPVAIKDPTAIQFRRNAGVNVLTVGQSDEQVMAMFNMMIVSLAAQQGPKQATIYVLDGTPADSQLAGTFEKTAAALPEGQVKLVDFKATADALDEVLQELNRRRDGDESGPNVYVFIYGLQRYRVLRKSEDDFGGGGFSFESSGDDAPKKTKPDKALAEILREGPPVGIHVVAWCDTMVSIDRTFDRGVMREFDNRILFQMSASDSSNLIDNPAANKLGPNRALVYSEEQGTLERFRPYALPDTAMLTMVRSKLAGRAVD
jgi:S-DNA-T family DNA segregation ATPase FtsK/SpoIIIE